MQLALWLVIRLVETPAVSPKVSILFQKINTRAASETSKHLYRCAVDRRSSRRTEIEDDISDLVGSYHREVSSQGMEARFAGVAMILGAIALTPPYQSTASASFNGLPFFAMRTFTNFVNLITATKTNRAPRAATTEDPAGKSNCTEQ